MSNLRIIHNNAADRASITASTTAGTLAAANMLTDLKGQVHRSTGTSVTYTLTWTTPETVAGVSLPACNLTADATVRARAYDAGGNLLFDSGAQYACPGPALDAWDWTLPLNNNSFSGGLWNWPTANSGNAFAYGGAARTVVWFDSHYAASRIVIDLVDTNNAAGYIDCARVIVGGYWSPQYNAGYGAMTGLNDGSKNSRNDAGDLLTDRFATSETLKLDLHFMPSQDRARMTQIMRSTGMARPVLVAVIPDGSDPLLTQDTLIYGKRQNSAVAFEFYNAFSSNLTIEGW